MSENANWDGFYIKSGDPMFTVWEVTGQEIKMVASIVGTATWLTYAVRGNALPTRFRKLDAKDADAAVEEARVRYRDERRAADQKVV